MGGDEGNLNSIRIPTSGRESLPATARDQTMALSFFNLTRYHSATSTDFHKVNSQLDRQQIGLITLHLAYCQVY